MNSKLYFFHMFQLGCGCGKYLDVNPHIFNIGSDRCKALTQIAREKEHEVSEWELTRQIYSICKQSCQLRAQKTCLEQFDRCTFIYFCRKRFGSNRRITTLSIIA